MPAPRKKAGTRQDTRPGRRAEQTTPTASELVVAAGAAIVDPTDAPPPPCPAGLLKVTRDAWARFWASDIAKHQADIDLVVAERWAVAYDEWQRALRDFRKQRIVPGSTGQDTLNPLAKWVASRELAMARAEQQLGIGLRDRLTLGITFGQAAASALELNRMVQEDAGGHHEEGGDVDVLEAEILEEFEAG